MFEQPRRDLLEGLHSLHFGGGVLAEPCSGWSEQQDRKSVLQESPPFALAERLAGGLFVTCDEFSDPVPWNGFWVYGQLTTFGEDAAAEEIRDVVDTRSLGGEAEVEVDRLTISISIPNTSPADGWSAVIAHVDRLVAAVATVVHEQHDEVGNCVLLQDPEGNEFCVH